MEALMLMKNLYFKSVVKITTSVVALTVIYSLKGLVLNEDIQ